MEYVKSTFNYLFGSKAKLSRKEELLKEKETMETNLQHLDEEYGEYADILKQIKELEEEEELHEVKVRQDEIEAENLEKLLHEQDMLLQAKYLRNFYAQQGMWEKKARLKELQERKQKREISA